ncbi:DUF6526 family protein [Pseudalkalibacillus sp. SCS-8]|uniref:DUF6526 family protein n=1 Tax=Pseudalkalibacillus nanhaiensis TaxID=3115291 RepID=UPI0032DB2CD0
MIDPKYHVVLTLLVLTSLILSIAFVVQNIGSQLLLSLVVIFMVLTVVLIAAIVRIYALKLQDRIIRSEENFRYYRLTGELLDPNLKINQIIALRFAEDEEYVELVERAKQENLSTKDIKKAVRNWRADHHRV